jgi:hypothetical protein
VKQKLEPRFSNLFLESKAEAFHKSKESPNSGMNGCVGQLLLFS